MHSQTKTLPKSWLAFDLNILRRVNFSSVAIPFAEDPAVGAYLKRLDARVMANDPLRSVWAACTAQITNNGERLSDEEVNVVLEDAYVPGYKLRNPALSNWFTETDSWWFDNVRHNIERLQSQMSQAIASSIVLSVGNYVLSFKEETDRKSVV